MYREGGKESFAPLCSRLTHKIPVPPRGMADQRVQRNNIGVARSEATVLVSLVHKPDVFSEPGGEDLTELLLECFHRKVGAMNLLGYLVRRYAHPTDRRNRVIRLTAAGRKLIEKAFREHASVMEDIGKSLSPEERGVLIELLKRLGKGAEELLRRTS